MSYNLGSSSSNWQQGNTNVTTITSGMDTISIQRTGGVEQLPIPEEVRIRRVEVNRIKEVEHINLRIAEATEKIIEAQRVRKDEAILAAEALKMGETSRANALQARKVVELQEQLKLASLQEEQELEAKRAMVHERAVAAENARANARAEEVLYLEQEKEAQKLSLKHQTAAEHAAKIEKAYELVRAEAERRKTLIQNDVEIEVQGSLLPEIPEAAQIRVEVQPQPVPEVLRMAPATQVKASAKLAEVMEHIPQHAPVHVPVQQSLEREYIREETQTIRVGKEEALRGTDIETTVRPLNQQLDTTGTSGLSH